MFSTLEMSNMSRTLPQVRIDESNRSLNHIRDYGDDNEVSSPIEGLDRDGQGVTVRRPVPVPFPVLLLLAHNMIGQSTILYFISRVLLVWKH